MSNAAEIQNTTTKLGEEPLIHPTASVTQSTLGRYTEITEHCRISETEIDDYSYVMEYGMIWCARIGKFANIAANVRINATNHPLTRPTLHHFTYRAGDYWPDAGTDTEFFAQRRARYVSIGHDTWIGHGSTILPGVRIGNGAVVGAGAVVSKDVEPFMIVGGVPAKNIRPRFPEKIAERYQALAWWDWDHARIRLALEDFRNLSAEEFLDKYEA
jgi:phosphonate metabolism protein (transferase hexapeptide repeat family)